jgi:hypothetical protein
MNNDCPIVNNPFTDPDHENDLIIQMVATGKYLIFRDGIDSFSRSYNLSWDSVNVYGRQDAIQTYQSTGETINLDFPLKPGDNPDEFNMQLDALLALGKFVRPFYTDAGVIKEAPLLRIRYRNLIVEEYNEGKGTPVIIAPTNVSVNYGDRARDVLAPGSTNRKLIVPKRIAISLGGAVINVDQKYYDETSLERSAQTEEVPPVEEGGPADEDSNSPANQDIRDTLNANASGATGTLV